MNRRDEIQARINQLDAEIPEQATRLEDMVFERRALIAERLRLTTADRSGTGAPGVNRKFRVIRGGRDASAIGIGLLLARIPRRAVIATASTAVLTATLATVVVAAPHAATQAAPAPGGVATLPASLSRPLAAPRATVASSGPGASVSPPTASVTAVATPAQSSVTVAVAGGRPYRVVVESAALILRVSPSLPRLLPSSVPAVLPSVLPSVAVSVGVTPSGTCLLAVNVPPVIGACVL